MLYKKCEKLEIDKKFNIQLLILLFIIMYGIVKTFFIHYLREVIERDVYSKIVTVP